MKKIMSRKAGSGFAGKKFIIIIALTFLAAGCNPFSKSLPAGVVKSTNGGLDWQFSNTIKNSQSGLEAFNISSLAFDPGNRQVLYAGSYGGGLYKSEDAAGSWSNVLSKISVYDLAVNPSDTKIIYAAGLFNGNGRVLKTTDGGASWNQVFSGETANDVARTVALNSLNPNLLAVGTSDGTVVKSADGGDTWQLVKSFSDQINRVLWQDNNLYVLTNTTGLFKSSDFGQSFTELTASIGKSYSLAGLTYTNKAIDNYNQVYVDFSAPSLIYLATSNGLYKTVNEGQAWVLLSLPIQPTKSLTKTVAVNRANSNIVFTSVGSTIYKSLDGGQTWQTQGITSGGYINAIAVDPQLPQIVYAGIYSTQ